jgi:purine-nucleoside/S-methyl-5'-thioadenosine phosphorylase / adenosine deaminase
MGIALRSRLLSDAGFEHAFFLRAIQGSIDRAAQDLGIPASRLYYLSQVHGREVRVLHGGEERAEVARQQGDVTASASAGVGCAVRTADCPAVLLADRNSGAVAAIHSGWRGTVAGAVAAGVGALRRLHADTDLIAAIGPCIEVCCFEVGNDVAAQLAAASPAAEEVILRGHEKPYVDLRRVLAAQLHGLGIEEVEQVPGCTMCDAERFDSFRRDGPKNSGRMLAAIVAGSVGRKPGA